MPRLFQGLRGKVLLVLALVALIPALLLGSLGLTAVTGLSGLARDQARTALDQELRQRLISRAQEKARADDALLQGVLAQAVSLGRYVKWYYDYPDNRPAPGYLRGGSDLVETPLGHRVNQADTLVGVFVSQQATMSEAVWQEVGALSFADPMLMAIGDSTSGARRAWVISATQIVRVYPNPGLGHAGSPVGPDYDMTRDEPFQAAGPGRNPAHQPGWTAPYRDPVTGDLMITAVAPIYSNDGQFRAVAGVDMALTGVMESVLREDAGSGSYAFLLDHDGRVITAPDQARSDLGLPTPEPQTVGQAVVTSLDTATAPGVVGLAARLKGAPEPGMATFASTAGRRHVAFAPLPATGWVLSLVAPSDQVEQAAASVQGAIRRQEMLFLVGGGLAALLALGAAVAVAMRASANLTRPVADLVEGTRRLALDLTHRLPDDGGPDEFGVLARAFNTMAASLEQSRAEAVRQGRLVVEERNRLAREIHDTIAQGLTGIVVHLETAEDCMGPAPDPEALKHLDRARTLARESLREARRSVWNLRPSQVEGSGLPHALEGLAAGMRQDGFDCTFSVDGAEALALTSGAEDALFRVCQEALANVRKHSGARQVAMRLRGLPDQVILEITDDGRGFDAAALDGPRPEGGYGLWAMRERMEQAGGTLHVQTGAGQGVRITATVAAPSGWPDGGKREE